MKSRIIFIFLAVFFLTAGVIRTEGAGNESRILVKYKDDLTSKQAADFDDKFGSGLEEIIPGIKVRVVKVPADFEDKLIEKLKEFNQVEYAESDAVAQAFYTPDDTYYSEQWALGNVGASYAWDASKSSPQVIIAILDTGIDYDHGDLKSKITSSKNFTKSKTASDKNGHGTHVAGIAAAVTDNNKGVAGMGFNSSILNIKVLSDNGSGYYSWISNGIVYAADSGAKVINMSLGGSSDSKTLQDAVKYAHSKGVVLVAAAGNDGISSPSYPAYYPEVIAVAATDKSNEKASFSNFGDWVDLAAPGTNIISTYPHIGRSDRYAYMSGTSMASPYVAGLAALVWTTASGTDNQTVRDRIEESSQNIGQWLNYGLIDARKALDF